MLEIRLIGRPEARREGSDSYRLRSRKSWAVLCYLLLTDVPPTRSQVSSMLFSEANDPMRALRWSLSELRRMLGPEVHLEGDPLVLRVPEDSLFDVHVVLAGQWEAAIQLPNLGEELLDGFGFASAPHFELWLLAERRHVAAASEDVLREACLGYLGRGEAARAIPLAVSLVALNPYDENHQALLIRSYALSGDTAAAERQFRACTDLFAKELGSAPGLAIRSAVLAQPDREVEPAGEEAVLAAIESGITAVTAGALEAGVNSLRLGMALADSGGNADLQARARLDLAESLIHSVRGDDEEGAELLHGAMDIAHASRLPEVESKARVELGYTDMLGGRYDRAQRWLDPAHLGDPDEETAIKALTYLGVVESDRARYERARSLVVEAVERAGAAGLRRRETYAMSMVGRLLFLVGDLSGARDLLAESIDRAEADGWLAFLPWPQAFLGEVMLESGDVDTARQVLRQAFARACQIGDPCWEGVTGRALALLALAEGDAEEGLRIVGDALDRCRRLSDTYKWAEAYVLEARCRLGVLTGSESASAWIEELFDMATRTGMRELQLRAMTLRAEVGEQIDAKAILDLREAIENPRLVETT